MQLQGLPNIFQGSGTTGSYGFLWDVGIILFWLLVLGLLGWFVWRKVITPMRFPVEVVVVSKRGDKGNFLYTDKGRFARKKSGFEEFKLLKRKKAHIMPPSYNHLYPAAKGKAYLFLREVERNNFFPLAATSNINDQSLFDIGISNLEQKQWVMLEINKLMQELQPKLNTLEKYGHYIAFFITIILITIIIWIVMGKVSETNAVLSATQDRVSQIAERIYGGVVGSPP
jgi:hypothetical protein